MLVNKGSVFDLAAMYIVLIEKHQVPIQRQKEIITELCIALDAGCTFDIIKKGIFNSFYSDTSFNFNNYKKNHGNLIKQGVMYYHKELKLMNDFPIIHHDIDSGTMTSSTTQYYLEEVASYTMDDLLKYFYSKEMADPIEYNAKRMAGIFRHKIDMYGLDKVLFMIEGMARMYDAEHKVFTLSDFDSYNSTASGYLEEIKNNCKYSGGDKYEPKKRKLFG